MSKTLTGGCLCGAVRYTITAEPFMQAVCHCKNCQRQAGSGWSMILGLPESGVESTGTVQTYVDHGTSGGEVHRQFCPTCGTGLFYTNAEMLPGIIDIQSATLDTAADEVPGAQIQCAERLAWIDDLAALHRFERYPGQ
mgnify:CR=1 FL=1